LRYHQEWVKELLKDSARIVVRHGGRPITRYAVILEHRAVELLRPRWQAVRLIDNHMDKCHMHRYDRDRKLAPEPFGSSLSINEELDRAIRYLVEHHEPIIEAWRDGSK
jgi:hypothetical protein